MDDEPDEEMPREESPAEEVTPARVLPKRGKSRKRVAVETTRPPDAEELRRRRESVSYDRAARPNKLDALVRDRRASVKFLDRQIGVQESSVSDTASISTASSFDLDDDRKELLMQQTDNLKKFAKFMDKLKPYMPPDQRRIEVRLRNVSYMVPVSKKTERIRTIVNQSPCYQLFDYFRGVHVKRMREKELRNSGREGEEEPPSHKAVLKNISLALKPGKMYLILGPPQSGKTTLLRAISSLLPCQAKKSERRKKKKQSGAFIDGDIEYNGMTIDNDDGVIFSNTIAFIGQLDDHAPRLTVKETFDFAFQCKSGGTHRVHGMKKCAESDALVKKLDEQDARVNLVMEGLGLDHVKDTFVGNTEVRGVSGGQRRRVTCGEMMQFISKIMCADEISTGLDAASTFDIINSLMYSTRLMKMTRVISLLQPSPETFSLFDEVLLLMEGYLVYAGPVEDAAAYFSPLGYDLPDHMDVADFLQMVTTADGEDLFRPTGDYEEPLTAKQFADEFSKSQAGQAIQDRLAAPYETNWRELCESFKGGDEESGQAFDDLNFIRRRFKNSFPRSLWINFVRNFTIWYRDRRFLIANAIKNVIMGLSVGAVFFQTDHVASIMGVLFQGMLFIMLGAMNSAPSGLDDRLIYYRHRDANFYPTFAYVIGRGLSFVPQSFTDCIIFGTILYWMVGLAPTGANFFIFIAVIITFSLVMGQQLGIFAAIAPTGATVQAASSVVMLFLILFCGFIVAPDVIPNYYSWLYWWNPLAWAYRALIVNEYTSDRYSFPVNLGGRTVTGGDILLVSKGFVAPSGQPFGKEWIGYSFAYLCPYILLCLIGVGLGLKFVRIEGTTGTDSDTDDKLPDDEDEEVAEHEEIDLPFTPVDLTFADISYEVKASTGKDMLKLLNGVNGVFKSGRMCALMGSSGAGKTTLMDVIAMRKTSGTVTGEVKLNGFSQEQKTFRRCAGYVEQFDVQSPELTVRETIEFSAVLRLDSSKPETDTKEKKLAFVDQIIAMLELQPIEDDLVGNAEEGGLSFEQKKRLSIAVELAASPSIIFLDEPTSGLDSRAALIVMRSMKRIANTGRTVCATIHQPSSAVFEMFDDLLLLKKGGEVVFFGELGEKSYKLVDYFEGKGANPIDYGENPATWMLTVIASNDKEAVDYAELYRSSEEFKALQAEIAEMNESPDETKKITYPTEYATSFRERNSLCKRRLVRIYWRSPTYNLGRLVLSLVIAFLLGSVFITQRNPPYYTETQMASILSTIFIGFIIIGVLAQMSVLPVMLSMRDVFYRHRQAGMLGAGSLTLALGVAEKRFICLASVLFCLVFYFTMGFDLRFIRFAAFWGFWTFNLAIYSYFGQAFMCLVRGMGTAGILCSVFIGINNLFSGLIVRPQFLTGFWSITYWICPGHYVFEGLVMSQFYDDETPVQAFPGSEFFNATEGCSLEDIMTPCVGTVASYVDVFFGGRFSRSHIWYDALALGIYLTAARILTWAGLRYFNYVST